MSGQVYSLTDPEVVSLWEKTLDREIRARDPLFDPISGLAGTGPDALVQQKDQLTEGAGAFLRTKLKYQLSGRGRAGDEVLKGHEEPYLTSTFDVYVNSLRHAYAVSSPIVQQWINWSALAVMPEANFAICGKLVAA